MSSLQVGYMNPNFTPLFLLVLLLSCLYLQGCTQHHAFGVAKDSDKNSASTIYGDRSPSMRPLVGSAEEEALFTDVNCESASSALAPANFRVDRPMTAGALDAAPSSFHEQLFKSEVPLSPGDLIEVVIENGEGFNGRYEINSNGLLLMPMLQPITAEGLSASQLSEKIELSLIKSEMFRPANLSLSVQLLKLASIEVFVSGAVFEPGRALINDKIPAQVMKEKTVAFGDHESNRMLSEALRAASGVRPDAKLDQVRVIRQGMIIELDLSGILTGERVNDIPLVAGDKVMVASTGCFQPNLVRPSQITPKGFRVFMSNLIEPAYSNANAGVGSFASSLPYGSRLLQAAVSANCVGGKQWTNAPRKILLASKNPLTGKTQVIERSIEQLIRNPELPHINPFVMPNDAIACYDSDASNLRDAARMVTDLLNPFTMKLE